MQSYSCNAIYTDRNEPNINAHLITDPEFSDLIDKRYQVKTDNKILYIPTLTQLTIKNERPILICDKLGEPVISTEDRSHKKSPKYKMMKTMKRAAGKSLYKKDPSDKGVLFGKNLESQTLFDDQFSDQEIVSVYKCDDGTVKSEFEHQTFKNVFKLTENQLLEIEYAPGMISTAKRVQEMRSIITNEGVLCRITHRLNYGALYKFKRKINALNIVDYVPINDETPNVLNFQSKTYVKATTQNVQYISEDLNSSLTQANQIIASELEKSKKAKAKINHLQIQIDSIQKKVRNEVLKKKNSDYSEAVKDLIEYSSPELKSQGRNTLYKLQQNILKITSIQNRLLNKNNIQRFNLYNRNPKLD